jgi:hydrophobic/amphiphilic exporter-1 (mainly G- bacteria), HAE1 family
VMPLSRSFPAPLAGCAALSLVGCGAKSQATDRTFFANYACINFVDELTRVPGIARMQIFGAGQYAMGCWVKPDQLAKLHITVPQIIAALQIQNQVNRPGRSARNRFRPAIMAKKRITEK